MSVVAEATGARDETMHFASLAAFETWLEAHHTDCAGIWLKLGKKTAPEPSVTYREAVDVALRFGWIDGSKAKHDDAYWLQRFTPRAARSRWSQINRDKAEDLIAAGLMRPAGLAEVTRAKADGRWDAAYASPSTATVPDDLQAALDGDPELAAAFAALNAANRYAIIWRLNDAKRPETRARRLTTFIGMLHRGERLH
jgi:uncharacterized protein YdeI (YjbR/CyaY-like superfamily)